MTLNIHVANFGGRCAICEEPIREGQDIVRVEHEWVHVHCAEDEGFEVAST